MTWLGHKKNKSNGDNPGPTAAAPLGWRYAGPQPPTYAMGRPSQRHSAMGRPTQFHRAPEGPDNFKKVSISRRTLNKAIDDIDSDLYLGAASIPTVQSQRNTPDLPRIDTSSPPQPGATFKTAARQRRQPPPPPVSVEVSTPIKRGESVPPRSSSKPPPIVTRLASTPQVPEMSTRPAHPVRPQRPRAMTSAGALPSQPIPEGSEMVPLMLDMGNGNGRSSLESIAEAAVQQRQDPHRRSERRMENKKRYKKMQMENHNLWVLLDARTRELAYVTQCLQTDGKIDPAFVNGLENNGDIMSTMAHYQDVDSHYLQEESYLADPNFERTSRRYSRRDTAMTNLAELKLQLQQLLNHVEEESSPPPYGRGRSPCQYFEAELEGTIPDSFTYANDERGLSRDSEGEMTGEAAVDTLCPAPLRHHLGGGDVQLVEKLENHAVEEEKRASQFLDGPQLLQQTLCEDERPLTMLRVLDGSPRSETSRYSKRYSQFDPTLSVRYDTPKSAIVRSYLEMAPTRTSVAYALKTPTPPPVVPPKSARRLTRIADIHPALRAPSLDSDHGSDSSDASPPGTPPDVTRSPVDVTIAGSDVEEDKKNSTKNLKLDTSEASERKRVDLEPLHWLTTESPM